jgi:hypothetical protein
MLEMFAIKIYNPYKLSIKCIPHNTTVIYLQCLIFLLYKCGHRNVLSKRQVWMSIYWVHTTQDKDKQRKKNKKTEHKN